MEKYRLRKLLPILERVSNASVYCLAFAMFGYPDNRILMMLISSMTVAVLMLRWLMVGSVNLYFFWSWAFTTLVVASVIWAYEPMIALSDALKVLLTVTVCFLVSVWLDSYEKITRLFNAILLSNLWMISRIILAVPFSYWGTRRFSYIFGLNVNPLSMRLVLGVVLAMFLIFDNSKKKVKFIYAIHVVISLGMILLLGSRRSLVAASVGFMLLRTLTTRKIMKSVVFGAIITFVLIYVSLNVPILYTIIGQRLERTVYSVLGSGALDAGRANLISRGWDLFAQRPFGGWGAGNYQYVSGFGMYSHNNYVELLVSFGILGFPLFYVLHCIILLRTRIHTRLGPLSITLLFILLLSDFAAPGYDVFYIHLFLAMLVSFKKIDLVNQYDCDNKLVDALPVH